MKRSTKALTFAAVAAAGLAVSGCWRDFVAVYGPPPDDVVVTSEETIETEDTKTSKESDDNNEVCVYGPAPDTPVDGPEVDVYGPAPDEG